MKTSNLFRIALAILMFAYILSSVEPVLAATVTLRVASVQGQAGSTVDVPVNAVAAPGVGALHLELVYDPRVLAVDGVARGPLAGNNALLDSNPGTPGRLLIGLATLDAIKGDGSVASVRFKLIGDAGTKSAVTLENTKAWESASHAEVLVRTEAGQVTVTGGLPIWLWALLMALVALLLLFILFFIFVRRRRRDLQPVPVQSAYGASPLAVAPPTRAMPNTVPPPPIGLPERPAPVPATPGNATFKKAEDEFFMLKGRLSAGRITQEEFEASLKGLMTQDAEGRYWIIGADSGKWYVHNGESWVEGQPY